MCGEQAIKTIQDNWHKYVPVLLEQAAPKPPVELDEEDLLKAVEAIDKKLRPSGAGSKTTAAFAIFKVPYIVTEFYCVREPNKQHVTHHQQGLMGGGGEGGWSLMKISTPLGYATHYQPWTHRQTLHAPYCIILGCAM